MTSSSKNEDVTSNFLYTRMICRAKRLYLVGVVAKQASFQGDSLADMARELRCSAH